MGSPLHGINGLIYIAGTEITGGNAWALATSRDTAEAAQFGDNYKTVDSGAAGWSGSVSAWNHLDSQVITTAAASGASVALLLYPDRATLTAYYSGSAFFSMNASTAVGAISNRNGSFVGAGDLTVAGFS